MNLKPCPFCNGRANEAFGVDHIGHEYAQCLCNTCGAEGTKVFFNCYPFQNRQQNQAIEEASEAWNTRIRIIEGSTINSLRNCIFAYQKAIEHLEDLIVNEGVIDKEQFTRISIDLTMNLSE